MRPIHPLAVLIGLTAVACFRPPQSATEAIQDATATTQEAVTEAVEAPPTMATTAPADDQLGTLPEGVGTPVGEPVPFAVADGASGTPLVLSELHTRGPVLLVFTKGTASPTCNHQLQALGASYEAFQERGIRPVAVSGDSVEQLAQAREGLQLPYVLLSDPDGMAHKAFKVDEMPEPAEAQVAATDGQTGTDGQADETATDAQPELGVVTPAAPTFSTAEVVPAMFLIDSEGVVRWSHASADDTVRPTPEQVLAIVDGLEGFAVPAAPEASETPAAEDDTTVETP